jgi:general stress protein 26
MPLNNHNQILSILNEVDDMTIATVRPDGFPQATTVSFVNEGFKIYFGTGPEAQKAQNIRRENKVSLTVNRPYLTWNDIEGLSIGGLAREVTDKTEIDKVAQLIFTKFPQISETFQDPSDAVSLFRVDPIAICLLDYAKGFGHTELQHL